MNILALDFDGVICDSAGEVAVAGWKAAGVIWPERFIGDPPDEIVRRFRRVRPVMKTGYESILLVRLLRYGFSVHKIVENAPDLFSGIIQDESLVEDELVHLFGQTRDVWMADDLPGWIDRHEFYGGVIEAVNQSDLPVYIITTKEKRFAWELCRSVGLQVAEENIFGLESGQKGDVLATLALKHPRDRFHFVEDRLPTLLSLSDGVGFDLRLYLADWGYLREDDLPRAEKIQQIDVLSLDGFPIFVNQISKEISHP